MLCGRLSVLLDMQLQCFEKVQNRRRFFHTAGGRSVARLARKIWMVNIYMSLSGELDKSSKS